MIEENTAYKNWCDISKSLEDITFASHELVKKFDWQNDIIAELKNERITSIKLGYYADMMRAVEEIILRKLGLPCNWQQFSQSTLRIEKEELINSNEINEFQVIAWSTHKRHLQTKPFHNKIIAILRDIGIDLEVFDRSANRGGYFFDYEDYTSKLTNWHKFVVKSNLQHIGNLYAELSFQAEENIMDRDFAILKTALEQDYNSYN